MIWVVSKTVCKTKQELDYRHNYIKEITNANVSNWKEFECTNSRFVFFPWKVEYYMCLSDRGEYGIVITAHINEVSAIFNNIIRNKCAIVVVNSCELVKGGSTKFLDMVLSKNKQSELFFAKQDINENGEFVNYADNVGKFGFRTTLSERQLFMQRNIGLTKAIRKSYEKVVVKSEQS